MLPAVAWLDLGRAANCLQYVRFRGMGTPLMGTILDATVPQKNGRGLRLRTVEVGRVNSVPAGFT